MSVAKENIKRIHKILEKTYGSPRLGNKKNPLNELLYIQLSLRTTGPSFERVYKGFKKTFPKWDMVYEASEEEVAKGLHKAGLSRQKAANLKRVLQKLKSNFRRVSLAPLSKLQDKEVEEYLCSLPGIGKKSARCIMLYSFDRKVFPVDAHCFRIVKRLGWIRRGVKYNDKVADKIQGLIPHEVRYPLHVNMVAHGRKLCLERFPKCSICPLLEYCPFGKKRLKRK